MRYLLLILLLTGCVGEKTNDVALSPDQLAKYAAKQKRCDYMIGGPRDEEVYLKCMEIE
jgi:hypothetical protein